jgi:hypothetical protein
LIFESSSDSNAEGVAEVASVMMLSIRGAPHRQVSIL